MKHFLLILASGLMLASCSSYVKKDAEVSLSSGTASVDRKLASADSGPYVCACETTWDKYNTAETRMVVTDLGTGKEFKLGLFPGTSRAASELCAKAIAVQAVCASGKARD